MLQLLPVVTDSARLVDCGLDWWRGSWPGELSEFAPTFDDLRVWYDRMVLGGEGSDSPRPQNLLGYTGRAYGAAWIGERNGDVLVQASGAAARHIWWLPGSLGAVCTRLDIQATFRVANTPTAVVRAAALASEHARRGAVGRPWKIRWIDGHGDGDTTYIGSRHSDAMCRVYDKSMESPGEELYRDAVRFEVELKGDASRAAWPMVSRHNDRRQQEMSVLAEAFAERGILDLGERLAVQPLVFHVKRPDTLAEQKLLWLERQVRPTVQWLLRNGFGDGTMYALGLE